MKKIMLKVHAVEPTIVQYVIDQYLQCCLQRYNLSHFKWRIKFISEYFPHRESNLQ